MSEPVLVRAFDYFRNVDQNLGDRVESGVRAEQTKGHSNGSAPAAPARDAVKAKA